MSECDIALQIGTGAIAGVAASGFFLLGAHIRRRWERPKQIKVVRDHFSREFTLLANMKMEDVQPSFEDGLRYALAPDSWRRLLNSVNHLTGSLSTKERAALYSALGFLQDAHGHLAGTKTLSLEHLRGQYHVAAYTVGEWLGLPTLPPWEQPQQAQDASDIA